MAASLKLITQQILARFPMQHIEYAFCYGSGAFPQMGSNMSSNVLDFILVVSDAKRFHADNLALNSRDYSSLKYLGAGIVSRVQGRGVYFNTLVPLDCRTIKYGVVSRSALISDLTGTCYWTKYRDTNQMIE